MIELAIYFVLLSPLIVIFSTLKHEVSHAVAAMLSGYEVTNLQIFPSRQDGRWYWGYTEWQQRRPEAHLSQHVYLAPYYVDLVQVLVWFFLHLYFDFSLFVSTYNLVMLLLAPCIDSLWNFSLWRGDFESVFSERS